MSYRPRPLLSVGYDATPSSERALHVAAALAVSRGAELRVVHAFQYPLLPDYLYERLRLSGNRRLVHLRRHALEAVQAAAASITASYGLPARPVMADGPAGFVLGRESRHADLLVLGSRDADRIRRWLDPSIAETLASRSQCPVLTVRTLDPAYPPADAPVVALCHGADITVYRVVRTALREAADRGVAARVHWIDDARGWPHATYTAVAQLAREHSSVDCHLDAAAHTTDAIPTLTSGAGLVVLAPPSRRDHPRSRQLRGAVRAVPAHVLMSGPRAGTPANGILPATP